MQNPYKSADFACRRVEGRRAGRERTYFNTGIAVIVQIINEAAPKIFSVVTGTSPLNTPVI